MLMEELIKLKQDFSLNTESVGRFLTFRVANLPLLEVM